MPIKAVLLKTEQMKTQIEKMIAKAQKDLRIATELLNKYNTTIYEMESNRLVKLIYHLENSLIFAK